MTPETWLRALCDATGMPTQTDDIPALLAAWDGVVVARQVMLDAERPSFNAVVIEVCQQLIAELERRQDAWRVALAGARDAIGTQRVSVAKARRYQRSTNSADL